MPGIFGSLFDFDDDGKMDVFERTAEFMFLDEMMNEEEDDNDADWDSDNDDSDFK